MTRGTLRGEYAGFVSRMVAFGIDVAIIAISLLTLTWLLNTALTIFNLDQISTMETILMIVWSGLAALMYTAAYYLFFWTLAGQTPGKMLMGLRIVTTDGGPLSVGRSIRRFLGYIVSILAMWLGFIWILIDNRRQGWHDKIARTVVIYAWEARAGSYLVDRLGPDRESGQGTEQPS